MESVGSRMSEEATVLRESLSMNILIVDDEPSIRETCAEVARQAGMKAFAVASAEGALEVLENSAVDIVLTDLMLQQTSGLELLKRVHDTSPMLPVIVLTQYGTIDSAVAATRLGAVDDVTNNPLHERFLFVTGDVLAARTRDFLERNHLPHVAKPFRRAHGEDPRRS
jgi:DNA-binding NtrC family response regulator